MNKKTTRLFISIIFVCYSLQSFSQSTGINYSYTTGANAWIANAGAIVIPTNADEQLVTITPTVAQWNGFDYGGVTLPAGQPIYISSNGWISVIPPGAGTPPATALPINSLATNPNAIIAPFWDDLKTGPAGNVNWKIAGAVGNRSLTIEWLQMLWDHNGLFWAISFQVRLFERTAVLANNIDFKYIGNGVGGIANYNAGSGGASIGLSGFCAGDFYNYATPPSPLPVGPTPTKTAPEITNLGVKPANGTYYRFTPIIHPNNDCLSAQNLGTFSLTTPVIQTLATTIQSTQSIPSTGCWTASASYNDIWFTFTKPLGVTNFEIFTDSLDCRGVNYGMGMEVYTLCGGAIIACDENSAGPGTTNATSYLNFVGQPCAAAPYWVRVKTDNALTGYFRFNIRPPGRDCVTANDITPCVVASTYTSSLGLSTCGFVNDFDSANAACHSSLQAGDDYVFAYTPALSGCVNLFLDSTPANSNPGLYIYRGCPTTGSCVGSVYSTGGSTISFNNLSLAGGFTYYFVVDFDTLGTSSCLNYFDIRMTAGGAGPTNDLCSSPINIVSANVSTPCTGLAVYNNNCATPSLPDTVVTPNPGCGVFTVGSTPDVWFTFTSPNTQPQQIVVDTAVGVSAQDLSMAVYTGNCAGLTLVACDDNSNGTMPSATVVPPAAGTVYYIRIFSNDGTAPGNFDICIRYGCTPLNDQCLFSVPLTIGQPTYGDNSCSTGTGEPFAALGGPTCWRPGNTMNTVWFSFVATNDTMKIRTQLLTMYNSQIALYSSPCSTMTELFCNNNFIGCNGAYDRNSEIIATGLIIGNTYLISVDGRGAGTGSFYIVVQDVAMPYPPAYAQDCANPVAVCNNTTIPVPNPGFVGEGNVCDVASGSTCLWAGERGSSWYTFTVAGGAGGQTLQFSITPNTIANYDFMLWVIDTNGTSVPNYCSILNTPAAFPLTVCNSSFFSPTGCNTVGSLSANLNIPGPPDTRTFWQNRWSPGVFVAAGKTATFLLNINSSSWWWWGANSGYTLNWMGTAISNTAPSATWVNVNVPLPSTVWDSTTTAPSLTINKQAWVPNCNKPSCANGIPAFISPGGPQPVVTGFVSVKDITINAGATLNISAGATLSVCGNFTNNGTLVCAPGSIVKFVGNTNTSISGIFAATGNSFYNVQFAKDNNVSVTLNTNIYILGYDSIYSGIVNNNSKNTEVGGGFYNHNGFNSYTNLGSGAAGSTLTFTCRNFGGVAQPFRNDTSLLTLNNVTMNQVVVSNVRLNAGNFSDLRIGLGGVLTLTQGRIITPPLTVREVNILNTASASCSPGFGAPANSYVEGNLRRAIATATNSYDFPLGDGTNNIVPAGIVGFERANITYTIAPTVAFNLLGHFWRWSLGGVNFPAGNGPAASDCIIATYSALPYFNHGYWRMDASIGAPTGTYAATLYNNGFTNNGGSGWTVVKSPSTMSAWVLSGACLLPSTQFQTSRQGLTGFSDFTTVQSLVPLPIHLLFFSANANDNGVLCQWATATEINNDRFELERSKNNSTFGKIAQVKGFGAGTSTQTLSYNYLDEDACTGIVYYRLKQIDIDGKFSYSNAVAVNCREDKNVVTLFPNPANTEVNITFYETSSGKINLTMTDIFGSVVINIEQSAENGTNIMQLKINDLPAGVYYVQLKGGDEDEARVVKFLKY